MTPRLGFPRRSLSALACATTLLGVSACGSTTPQVPQAVKAAFESGLENGVPWRRRKPQKSPTAWSRRSRPTGSPR